MRDVQSTEPRRKLKGKRRSTKPKEDPKEGMVIEKPIALVPFDNSIEMKVQPQELKPVTHMQAKKRRKGPRAVNIE
jgi:hypothetical protein